MGNKNCSMANQLEENGIVLDCKWAFNPVKTYAPQRRKLRDYFKNLDGTQAVNRFKWVGAPAYFPAERIEQMLYHRGQLIFYKQGNEFRLLPFVSEGDLNIYGFMKKAQPIAYNGGAIENKKVGLQNIGDPVEINQYEERDTSKAVVLYDRQNAYCQGNNVVSLSIMQDTIIEEIVNRLSFLNINLVNSQGKNIIIVKDPKQARSVERSLENVYASDKSYSIVKSMFEVQVINNDITYEEQSLWEDAQSWNNLRLEGLGIDNNGMFNKKERVLTVQTKNDMSETEVVSDAFYEARKDFVKKIKEVFGNDDDFKRDWAGFGVIDLRIDNETKTATSDQNDDEGGAEDDSVDFMF